MVGVVRRLGGAAALAAMIATAMPAQARDRGDRGGRKHHRDRDRDKVDLGEALIGAAVIGGIAALISSAKKKEPAAETVETGGEIAFVAADTLDEQAAIAGCAAAAEEEGRRDHPLAQVAQVAAVDAAATGVAVRGDLLVRADYRDAGERRAFTCDVGAQGVRRVAIAPAVATP